jgi:DNA polymerase-1
VVFDAKGKTFRDDWYPRVQGTPSADAGRSGGADRAAARMPVVRALGWPLLMIDGVEADDVIGTLTHASFASRASTAWSRPATRTWRNWSTAHVRLVNTMSNEVLDEAGVQGEVRRGTRANRRLPDTGGRRGGWRTRRGEGRAEDRSEMDGRNSVRSTASSNMQCRDWRRGGREPAQAPRLSAARAIKLVTVACDLELPLKVEQLLPQAHDNTALAELFSRLEFKSWLKEVGNGGLVEKGELKSDKGRGAGAGSHTLSPCHRST